MRLPVFYPTIDGWREEWIGRLNDTTIACGTRRERDVRNSLLINNLEFFNNQFNASREPLSIRNVGRRRR